MLGVEGLCLWGGRDFLICLGLPSLLLNVFRLYHWRSLEVVGCNKQDIMGTICFSFNILVNYLEYLR